MAGQGIDARRRRRRRRESGGRARDWRAVYEEFKTWMMSVDFDGAREAESRSKTRRGAKSLGSCCCTRRRRGLAAAAGG